MRFVAILFVVWCVIIALAFAVGWKVAEPFPGAWPTPTPYWR